MPVYEYRCRSCRRKSSVFFRSISTVIEATCSHCGSREMERVISPVAMLRSNQDIFRQYDDMASLGDLDLDDPHDAQEFLERMGPGGREYLESGFDDFGDDGGFDGFDDL